MLKYNFWVIHFPKFSTFKKITAGFKTSISICYLILYKMLMFSLETYIPKYNLYDVSHINIFRTDLTDTGQPEDLRESLKTNILC